MKFRDKLIAFMYGRYGGRDALGKTLMGAYLVLLFVGALLGEEKAWRLCSTVAMALFVWYIFRAFSKNIYARQRENTVFLKWRGKIILPFKMLFDTKHAYRKCPYCNATLRLPKRKGRHTVCCPKCRRDFEVKI
jgi:hypothetical protein